MIRIAAKADICFRITEGKALGLVDTIIAKLEVVAAIAAALIICFGLFMTGTPISSGA